MSAINMIAPIERRQQPKLERVVIPKDAFIAITVTLKHASDGVLGLTQVLCRKAQLAGSTEDMNHFEPFILSINERLNDLQEMLRACMEESCPKVEDYHG